MEDPRITELMDYVDSVDESGKPTTIALIARRVASYTDVVDELREELDVYHNDVDQLEERAANYADSLKERALLRTDITEAAQAAVMKVAYTTTTGRSAQLREDAAKKQKDLKQFEIDYEADERRFKSALRALEGKQQRLMEVRDQIARRLNIVDALLQRAEIDWPSYFFDENERIKAKKDAETATVRRKPRRSGRRRVVRRRRAS